MCKILSYLCVSILLLGVTSCTETEKVDSDVTIQEQNEIVQVAEEIAQVPVDANVIVSIGDSKLTTQHAEWMQPNADPKLIPQMVDWWITNELLYAEAVKQDLGDEDKAVFLMDLTKKQVYAKALVEKNQNDAQATDDEILAYYEENKNTFPGFKNPATFNFVHIQVKTIADANSVVEKINAGSDPIEVAKETSIARDASGGGVAKNHIDRGIRSRFGDDFLKALSAAEIGQIIGPVKLKNGTYEVAVLNGKTPASIKTFEELKEQIKTQLTNKAKADAYKNLIDGLKAAAAEEIVESEMLKELKSPAPPARPGPPPRR